MTENITRRNRISLEESLYSKDSSITSSQKSKILTQNTTTKQVSTQPAQDTKKDTMHKNRVSISEEHLNHPAEQSKKQIKKPLRTVSQNKEQQPVMTSAPTKKTEKTQQTKITSEKAIKQKAVQTSETVKTNINKAQTVAKDTIQKTKELKKEIAENRKNSDEKKSIAEEAVQTIINNKTVDKAIRTSYKSIKHSVVSQKKERKKPVKDKFKRGYSQEQIPIKGIFNGIIQTTTGKYVKIMEILPINFYEMSVEEQLDTAYLYSTIYHNGPDYMHVKCITDKSNPTRLIQHIKEKCEEEKYQRGISDKVVYRAQDTINKIKELSEKSALSKRYFIIFGYEGRDMDPNKILFEMESTRQHIMASLSGIGISAIDYEPENATFETGEILYYFFNRKTCREESLQERITRIVQDTDQYNTTAKKPKNTIDVDFIAPKGLYFTNSEYIYMDGYYKTYLCLTEKGHPQSAPPGWLDHISMIGGDGTEIDIHSKRMPHGSTESALEQYNRIKRVSGNEKIYNQEKQQKIFSEVRANKYILDRMHKDEDLFNVVIIITLSAETISGLRTIKKHAEKQLNRLKLYVEPCYATTHDYFMATLPLTELPASIFNRNKRNYLTSSLATLFMFTSYELFDPHGYVLGINARQNNESIVAINPANTRMFTNANMSVFGMTGSGKTYSIQILGKSMRVTGNRVFYICPMKAHEFKRGCDGIDGSYIQLGPGMKSRVNICEIRPEAKIDKRILVDTGRVETSLLTKQIAFLMTWLQLIMVKSPMTEDESDLCEVTLNSLYTDFGYTSDNESIYMPDGTLRMAPVLGNIYDRFAEYPELARVNKALNKYVFGSCSNMNGQTNVDLTNKYICFDVDENNMTKDELPAFIFVAIKCVYDLVKQDRLSFDTIFLDEIWKLLMHPAAAEQVYDMVKIIRGYGGAVVPITQDVTDYLDSKVGQSILGGTAIKLIMYLERPQCLKLAETLGLTKEDIYAITHFERGQGMLITSQGKTLVTIKSSDLEDRDFTTDPMKLRMYAEQEQRYKNHIQQRNNK